MFCEQCGKQLRDGAKFCPGCGTQVTHTMEQKVVKETAQPHETPKADVSVATPKTKKKSSKVWGFPVVAVIAILLVGGLILSNSKPVEVTVTSHDEINAESI